MLRRWTPTLVLAALACAESGGVVEPAAAIPAATSAEASGQRATGSASTPAEGAENLRPGKDVFFVESPFGLLGGGAASLRVSFVVPDPPAVRFAFRATTFSKDQEVSLTLPGRGDLLDTHFLEGEMTTGPPAPGQANAWVGPRGTSTALESGRATATFRGDSVEGEILAEGFSIRFYGEYFLGCSVPPSSIPGPREIPLPLPVGEPGGPPSVSDVNRESEECRAFAAGLLE